MSKIPEHDCPRCKEWRRLVEGKDGLLGAYRLGRPPSEKVLKMIQAVKKKLGLED